MRKWRRLSFPKFRNIYILISLLIEFTIVTRLPLIFTHFQIVSHFPLPDAYANQSFRLYTKSIIIFEFSDKLRRQTRQRYTSLKRPFPNEKKKPETKQNKTKHKKTFQLRHSQ